MFANPDDFLCHLNDVASPDMISWCSIVEIKKKVFVWERGVKWEHANSKNAEGTPALTGFQGHVPTIHRVIRWLIGRGSG